LIEKDILRFYVLGNIKKEDGGNLNELLEYTRKSTQSTRDEVEAKYSSYFALHYIFSGNYDSASACIRSAQLEFVSSFSKLSPISKEARIELISGLQELVELKEYVYFSNKADVDPSTCLLPFWKYRLPSTDSLTTWDTIVSFREKVLPDEDVVEFQRAFSSAARISNNMALSDHWLAKSRVENVEFDDEFFMHLFENYNRSLSLASDTTSICDYLGRMIGIFTHHRESILSLSPEKVIVSFNILLGRLLPDS
jgi:hypothetical protein